MRDDLAECWHTAVLLAGGRDHCAAAPEIHQESGSGAPNSGGILQYSQVDPGRKANQHGCARVCVLASSYVT